MKFDSRVKKTRGVILRGVQFFLAFDGLLHLAEVASAYYEQAWTTLALTSFHASIFFLAAYFVGHDHKHHQDPHHSDESEKWQYELYVSLLYVAFYENVPKKGGGHFG